MIPPTDLTGKGESPIVRLGIPSRPSRALTRAEDGWALLGLLLALSILSIILVSTVVPNVQMQVRREKELELVYRGDQMSRAIARYYGRGALNPLQLLVPPEYGYLTELKKLKEGVTIGVKEIKFVRPSAFIDPTTGVEWQPVRARDPRIMKFLQAYAADTGTVIPTQYLLIAGPPQKLHLAQKPGDGSGATQPPIVVSPDAQLPQPGAQPQRPGVQPAPGGTVTKPQPNKNEDGDDDDDDDDDENTADPLGHLFSGTDSPGKSNVPIVGVAPVIKGTAIKPLYGLDKYEEWVFLYIPPQFQFNQTPGGSQGRQPGQPGQPGVPLGPPPPPPPGGQRPLN